MRYLIKAAVMSAVLCVMLTLTACSRTVQSASDELVMNRWETVTENGNRIELHFEDDIAVFTAQSNSFSLSVKGLYDTDDTALTINDEETHLIYRFTYVLHGDRIELTYGEGTLTLEKNNL